MCVDNAARASGNGARHLRAQRSGGDVGARAWRQAEGGFHAGDALAYGVSPGGAEAEGGGVPQPAVGGARVVVAWRSRLALGFTVIRAPAIGGAKLPSGRRVPPGLRLRTDTGEMSE